VFGIHGDDLVGEPPFPQDDGPSHHEGFLVRQSQAFSGAQSAESRKNSNGAHHGVEDEIHLRKGGKLGEAFGTVAHPHFWQDLFEFSCVLGIGNP
jgi:hypothetical protein